MKPDSPKYWFPLKTAGHGHGFPRCWQGWLAIFGYAALMIGGSLVINRILHPVLFYGMVIVITAIFVLVVWAKGEKAS